MTQDTPRLVPRAALSAECLTAADLPGVTVRERTGLGIAVLVARKGRHAALAQRVRERFGIELPRAPCRACAGPLAFAAIGPARWLATLEAAEQVLADSLRSAVGSSASVVDQSDGHCVLRLEGPRARAALARIAPVDVHPRTFRIGDVAATRAGHLAVTLWRVDDLGEGAPVFEIAAQRSYAASLWQALAEGA